MVSLDISELYIVYCEVSAWPNNEKEIFVPFLQR